VPVPDKHAEEPVTEIDKDYFKLWKEARAAADAWNKEVVRLRGLLEEQLKAARATAGTVDGEKVLTFRPSNTYAVAQLREQYPDLTGHFMKHTMVTELDIAAFAAAHPDIAEQFRSRSFREV
jgi:hypothetical protein